jgi:hypothetical protein
VLYVQAVPGICIVVSFGRRLAAGARSAAGAARGSRTGPIHTDIDAPAARVFTMMSTFEDGSGPGAAHDHVRLDDGVVIREFATPVSLPFGMGRVVHTREEIRLVPPNAIEFRHLAGPVRGMAELIVVEPLGDTRCRVTYTGELPRSGPVLGVAYRLLARPAIERVVRTHLADLAQRAAGGGSPALTVGRADDR